MALGAEADKPTPPTTTGRNGGGPVMALGGLTIAGSSPGQNAAMEEGR